MKEEFCFKKSWADALAELPERERLQVYNAIILYCLTGTVAELRSVAKGAFAVIKFDIDSADKKTAERQQSLSEKRSEAAKKSVVARRQKAEKENAKAEETAAKTEEKSAKSEEKSAKTEEKSAKTEGTPAKAEETPVKPEKETVKAESNANAAKSANARLAEFAKKYNLSAEYVSEINNIYKINNNNQEKETHKKEIPGGSEVNSGLVAPVGDGLESGAREEAHDTRDTSQQTQTEAQETQGMPRDAHEMSLAAQEIVDYFNRKNRENGSRLDDCSELTSVRRSRVGRAIRKFGIGKIHEAIDKVFTSGFLLGEGANGRHASFDWLFSSEHILRVWEGNYQTVAPQQKQALVIDPRRGTEAVHHEAWEYEADF